MCGGTKAGRLVTIVGCPASQISRAQPARKRPWLPPAALSRVSMGCTGSKPMVASSYDGKAHQAQGNGHLPTGEADIIRCNWPLICSDSTHCLVFVDGTLCAPQQLMPSPMLRPHHQSSHSQSSLGLNPQHRRYCPQVAVLMARQCRQSPLQGRAVRASALGLKIRP